MLEKIFSVYDLKNISDFVSFNPFPNASERNFWENISQDLKNEILLQGKKSAEKIKISGWPQIKVSAFLEFKKTGNRVNYENLYFNFRNLLTCITLAECVEHKGNFLEDIIDGIFLLCGHTAWQLPAHNSYIRDTPQLNFPDSARPILDLFACETGAQIAVIYFLLKSEFEKISPFICQRIETELQTRIIKPYLSEHFWWMGNEDEEMCNWTPWCTQNVLLTAFLLPNDFETRKKILQKALYSLDCFTKDYGEDGCCSEGAEYYRHAGLCLFNCMDIINKVCNGLLENLFKLPKIKNIAEFILNMNIPHTKFYFNFSDCSPLAGLCGAREFLFGKNVHSNELCEFASEHWKISSPGEKLLSCSSESLKQANIYYLLQSIFYDKEILNFAQNSQNQQNQQILKSAENSENSQNLQSKNIWYKSTGIFIVHKGIFSLAVKAGCNADSHNHNDTGSITLYKNGNPFLIDLGVETYSQKTFSSRRYEIWTMQSAYHNLPTVDGIMQKDGKEFCAGNVQIFTDKISLDIAKAYTENANLKSYKRTVQAKNNCVELFDEYLTKNSCDAEIVLSLMICEKPKINFDFIEVGTLGKIYFNAGDKTADVNLTEKLAGKTENSLFTENADGKAQNQNLTENFCGAPEDTLLTENSSLTEDTRLTEKSAGETKKIKSIKIEEIKITDEKLRLTWPEFVYRILISYKNKIHLRIE